LYVSRKRKKDYDYYKQQGRMTWEILRKLKNINVNE